VLEIGAAKVGSSFGPGLQVQEELEPMSLDADRSLISTRPARIDRIVIVESASANTLVHLDPPPFDASNFNRHSPHQGGQ
jgi:hypothetical protein